MLPIRDIEERVGKAEAGYTLSIESILQLGFNHFRKAPGSFILYNIIAMVAFSNPVSGLLLGGPMVTGYYVFIHRLRGGRTAEISDFFRSFDHFVPLLALNLLISLLVFIGLLLLVLPGIYFAVNYLFAHFFVGFFKVEAREALRMSRRVVSGNFVQIFLLWLILAGINFLGAMAFGVGLLLTLPFTFCVLYAAFDDIIGIP